MRKAFNITALFLSAALSMTAFAQDDAQGRQSKDLLTLMSVATRAPSTYLADGDGYALYVLVESESRSDERSIPPKGAAGDGDRPVALPCEANCRQAWPPLTVASAGAKIATQGTVDPALIGTTKLEDGSV